MNTKDKGNLGEMIIMTEFIKMGYNISVPLGDNCRYDFIAEKDGKCLKVQCKYTESKKNTIRVNCYSTVSGLSGGKNESRYYTSSEIDLLSVYDKTTNKCYYVYPKDFQTILYLRLASTKNNQKLGIRNAADYAAITQR